MNDSALKNSAEFDFSRLGSPQLCASYFSERPASESPGEKYIVFCLGGKFFAVRSKEAAEVVQVLAITALPNVPEWLLGIADLRGRIISVVSGRKLFSTPDADFPSKTKYIVLKQQNLASSVAIAVDKLNEIVVLGGADFQRVEDEKTPYLFGKTMYQSNALNLISVENLLASLTI